MSQQPRLDRQLTSATVDLQSRRFSLLINRPDGPHRPGRIEPQRGCARRLETGGWLELSEAVGDGIVSLRVSDNNDPWWRLTTSGWFLEMWT